MRVSLLGASFNTSNMGVSAITSGSIRGVLAGFPHAEISLLDYAREGRVIPFLSEGKTIPIRLVNIRFSKKFWLANNIARLMLEAGIARLIPFISMRRAWIARNPWLQHVQDCDLVAAISGGDSFSDIYGLPRFFYTCLPQLLALLMRKPLVLLPQTIGPFRTGTAQLLARLILRGACRVYTRDYDSREELERLFGERGMAEKAAFSYDVGFILDPIAPPKIETAGFSLEQPCKEPLVGLNVSGLLYRGDHADDNPFGLRVEYEKFISELVDFLILKKRAKVLLVPHVFGTGPGSEGDPQACEQVYCALETKHPGRLGVLRGSYNHHEIKHVIGRCDFFIGSRMHACIAAISQEIPTVCIAYSKKFIGVMETLGIESIVADARSLDREGIIKVVENSYDHREQIHDLLERTMPQVKRSALSLFEGMQAPAGAVSGPLPVAASCSSTRSGA